VTARLSTIAVIPAARINVVLPVQLVPSGVFFANSDHSDENRPYRGARAAEEAFQLRADESSKGWRERARGHVRESDHGNTCLTNEERGMAKYGKKAQSKVERAMHERKHGTLKSGRSGKKVTSRTQAIAIGLSEARKAGAKVPRQRKARSRKK
jgi:hypothetical protein